MKFRLLILLFIAIAIPKAALGDCSCGYPTPGIYICVTLTCNHSVSVITCDSPGYHDSCIWCSQSRIIPCCPDSDAWTASYGGNCDIVQAQRPTKQNELGDLFVQEYVQSCTGTIVPVVVQLHNPLAGGQRSL